VEEAEAEVCWGVGVGAGAATEKEEEEELATERGPKLSSPVKDGVKGVRGSPGAWPSPPLGVLGGTAA
jgi:hypothetical protein